MRSGDAAAAAAATSVSESSSLVMNRRIVKVLNSNISTSVTRRLTRCGLNLGPEDVPTPPKDLREGAGGGVKADKKKR